MHRPDFAAYPEFLKVPEKVILPGDLFSLRKRSRRAAAVIPKPVGLPMRVYYCIHFLRDAN